MDNEQAQSTPPPPRRLTAAAWAQAFQQEHGREPTMAEYQNALAAGQIARERDPSVRQMTEGVRQVGQGIKGLYDAKVAPAARDAAERSGAKDFFAEKVAPHAQTAFEAAKQSAAQASTAVGRRSPSKWTGTALLAMPAAALFAIISLFLPAVTGMGMSVNFFRDSDGEGALLLVLFLIVIAACLAALLLRKKWTHVFTAVSGIVVGFFGMGDGFGTMSQVSGGASVGFGLVLLSLSSLVIFIGGAVLLWALWQQRAAKRAAAGPVPGSASLMPQTPPAPPQPPSP